MPLSRYKQAFEFALFLAAWVAMPPQVTFGYAPSPIAGFCYRADGLIDVTRDYAYAYDGAGNVVRAGRVDATGQGRAAFEADGFNFHAVRRWNAIDLVGVARADAQILVNQQPVLRDGRRFVFALPLRQGSSAHVTNLTVLARVSNDDEGGG